MSVDVVQKNSKGTQNASKKDMRLANIYLTAAQIIERDGYDATSLGDIAKAVGLTKAGLYHYIPSKDNLLFGIMNYGMDRVNEVVIDPTRDIADAEERIRTFILNYLNLIIEDGQAMTIVITETQGLSSAQNRVIARRRRAFYDYLREIITDIKQREVAPVLDTAVTTHSVFGVLVGFAQWYRPGGRLSLQEVIDQITELTVGRMIGVNIAGRKNGR
ncbi:MAG TPA: TetR/AcrR family transcriptional regulator [Blastocatellia bacterium]|nr:TetR/AcrR family transcriptional regulator [Blastocatellia bacterium]